MADDVLGYADSIGVPGLADIGDVLDVATLMVERIHASSLREARAR